MKRIIFGILIIGVIYLGTSKTFAQCSCEPELTLKEHFQRSDVVFVGKVVETKKIRQENTDSYDVFVKFEVKQVWKRDLERFVNVKLYGSAKGFEPDTEWLLYALKGTDGSLQIAITCCSRTKLLWAAIESGDLKAFKKMGEKPKKIIDSKGEAAKK